MFFLALQSHLMYCIQTSSKYFVYLPYINPTKASYSSLLTCIFCSK